MGWLEGLKVCRRAPGITHLLFADDSLLFFRANAAHASNVKTALTVFERNTGQLLSLSKCSLFVRDGRSEDEIQQVRTILGVERVDFDEKYLGLPTPLGRVKRGMFQPLEAGFLNEWQLGVKRTCQQQVRKFRLNQLRKPSQTTL
jgi:hypothetical protein